MWPDTVKYEFGSILVSLRPYDYIILNISGSLNTHKVTANFDLKYLACTMYTVW